MIGFIGSKETTYQCLKSFGSPIDYLITLDPQQDEKFQVAGYRDLRSFAEERGIKIYHPQKYSLKEDVEQIKEMNLDLLITVGWQRLIPQEVLDVLKIGACGMHGSPWGLPRGRGRSPINWALIGGHKKFITSLILYRAGIDDGDIIGSKTLEITRDDDCQTLHHKNMKAMNELLKEHLSSLLSGKIELKKQEGQISYYPERRPEDGAIDWKMTAEEIYNFVRAQTHPFSGAFSFLNNQKITIWKAEVSPVLLERGVIKGSFVGTGQGSLLITDCQPELNEGRFTSVDYQESLQKIIKRYPSFVKDEEKEI